MAAKKRRSRIGQAFLWAVLVAGLACAGVGGWMLAKDEADVQQYEDLAQEAGPAEDITEDSDPGIDWDALRAENAAVCGWVSVDGTSISLPVVHASEDWPDKYLNYSFSGAKSQMGCPYLNWACDPNGRVMTIYGHHVWYQKKMFNELGDAYTASKFEQLGGAWWTTPELEGKRFRLVGSALISKWEGDEWNKTGFETAEDVRDWLHRILPDLTQKSDEADDLSNTATRVLVLATCTETGIKSKRSVTVFADPDPQFADHTQDVTWSAAACKALAGGPEAMAGVIAALGKSDSVSTGSNGVRATLTDRQLAAWKESSAKAPDDALAALKGAYPEVSASYLGDGTLEVGVPEGDEASWQGIAQAAEACLRAKGVARTIAYPVAGGSWNVRAMVRNSATGKLVSSWSVGDAGGWDQTAWEKSR